MGFLHFVDFVNFVSWVLDPSWDPSTLWTYLRFFYYFIYPCRVRPRCGLWFWSLVGSVHFVDLFKFVTLVESIHVVDCGLDHPWGPSTLWTYLSFLPSSGLSMLWTGVLTLGGVHRLCGFEFSTLVRSVHVVNWGLDPWWGPSTLWICICFLPLSGPSTLWTGVLTLSCVRPLYGLVWVFYPCRVRPRCGLGSWPLLGSIHWW